MYLNILAVIFAALQQSSSINLDIGTCGCMCLNNGHDKTMSNSFPSTKSSALNFKNQFLRNIKGKRGDVGFDGSYGLVGERGIPGPRGARGPPSRDFLKEKNNSASSCNDLRRRGYTNSGIYTIKTATSHNEIEVYCEMNTDGGGWNLVASVHENNIQGRCSPGDLWSGQLGPNNPGSNSWSNYATFGSVDSATSQDYKNSLYYEYKGENVMIWHILNNNIVQDWSNQSFLQYYTSNNFLTNYGGNLQTIYLKYLPLVNLNTSGSSLFSFMESNLRVILEQIVNQVGPSYHPVEYDDPSNNQLNDGGGDMYDGGNIVSYATFPEEWIQIEYNKQYLDFEHGIQLYSIKSQPFTTLMWVENPDGVNEKFGIKVSSDTGADGEGRANTISITQVTVGEITCHYTMFNIYNSGDPTIAELYFACFSDLWNSTFQQGDFLTGLWGSSTNKYSNSVWVRGYSRNFLMGYMLLSLNPGQGVFTGMQVDSYMRTITGGLKEFNPSAINCDRTAESITQPVQFIKGNVRDLTKSLTIKSKQDYMTGFIHFRPYSFYGKPYALCPGVKSFSCNPSRMCLGAFPSVNENLNEDLKNKIDNECGDFSKISYGNSYNGSSLFSPSSSVLIFVR